MSNKIARIFLVFFYIFCIATIIIAPIAIYRMNAERNNNLLTIQKKLDMQSVNETVKLELNEKNKDEKVNYESKNENIVQIDQEGYLYSVGEGTTEVVVTTEDKEKSQTIIVNVGSAAIENYQVNDNKDNKDTNDSKNKNDTTTNKNNKTSNKNTPTTNKDNTTRNKNNTTTSKNNTTTNKNNSTVNNTTTNNNKTQSTTKTVTLTLKKGDADSISTEKLTCTISGSAKSCSVTLPSFTNKGGYNQVWQSEKGSTYTVGSTISLSSNFVLTATGLHPYHKYEGNYYRTRNLSIQSTYTKGQTIFEYEGGIPSNAVAAHKQFLDRLYTDMPYLFNPGKVFVLTESSYSKYSKAYGLTHYSGRYFFIDLKYDTSEKVISENATIHEMAHGWDNYYAYKNNTKRISYQPEMKSLYQGHLKYIASGYNEGSDSNYREFFAATVTNYYWFILERNPNRNNGNMYIYQNGIDYSSNAKKTITNIMNKYKNS